MEPQIGANRRNALPSTGPVNYFRFLPTYPDRGVSMPMARRAVKAAPRPRHSAKI
jgi:hypothetical protein